MNEKARLVVQEGWITRYKKTTERKILFFGTLILAVVLVAMRLLTLV